MPPLSHFPCHSLVDPVQVGFSVFSVIAITFWGALITSDLVAKSVNQVSGPKSLAEASERGDSVCAYGWGADDLIEGLFAPSLMNPWDKAKVCP